MSVDPSVQCRLLLPSYGTQVVICYHLLFYKTLANLVGLKSLILAHVQPMHVDYWDVISRALRHVCTYPAATRKGVADLCLQCMCIPVLKIFLLRRYRYV